MEKKYKDLSIESLRGLAAILMVTGHVIGSGPTRGMQVPLDSAWHLGFVGLQDVRMPLFTLLSGFVYAYRPLASLDGYAGLLIGKAKRLLVPLVVVGTIYYLTQVMVPGTNHKPELAGIWRVYVFGHDHLWFLQAIFLIFMVVGLLNGRGWLRDVPGFLWCLAIACIGFLFHDVPSHIDLFSFGGFLRLLPFFLMGYGLNFFSPQPNLKALSLIGFTALLLGGLHLLQVLSLAPAPGPWPLARIQSFLVGSFFCLALFFFRERIYCQALAWIGQFSFSIYLLHVFGSAGTRLILNKTGIENNLSVFVACMTAAIGGPILFELIFRRNPLVCRLLLGQKPQRMGAKLQQPSARAGR